MYHGPNNSWTDSNLGQVFGVCIDNNKNIYVTATSSYGLAQLRPMVGPGGPGGVYKLNWATGKISVFAKLPNTGPALGNICYDWVHNQFFVTNFEDGKIYRLSSEGKVLSTFDPYQQDDGRPGFAPLGERPWGIAFYDNRIYYGVWWENYQRRPGNGNARNEIRSIGLGNEGEFLNDDRQEVQMDPISNSESSSPVSDITFSVNGRMLIAERTMNGDNQPGAHVSRVIEYTRYTGAWAYSQEFSIGNYDGQFRGQKMNSAGGVDFGYAGYDPAKQEAIGHEGAIWASGDALLFPGYNPGNGQEYVYGITRVPATGNTALNVGLTSYFVDLDNELELQNKTQIGDVEVYRQTCILPEIQLTANKYGLQVHPNTIQQDQATVQLSLAFDSSVQVEVFSVLGVRVGLLVEQELQAGDYRVYWNTADMPPGLYFVKMTSGEWQHTQQVIVR